MPSEANSIGDWCRYVDRPFADQTNPTDTMLLFLWISHFWEEKIQQQQKEYIGVPAFMRMHWQIASIERIGSL